MKNFSTSSKKKRMERIPSDVKTAAQKGLKLLELGFKGGTQTGWDRGRQLASAKTISLADLNVMRAWFARHGPDAKNGGTSYPGYCQWLATNQPHPGRHRGAVSWLLWGGDAAYKWLKTSKIRKRLKDQYPSHKESTLKINLSC